MRGASVVPERRQQDVSLQMNQSAFDRTPSILRARALAILFAVASLSIACAETQPVAPSPTPDVSPTPEVTPTPTPTETATPEPTEPAPVARPDIPFLAVRVEEAPADDNLLDSPVWEQSNFELIELREAFGDETDPVIGAMLRAVHTGDRLYVMIEWDDSTEDAIHKPWIWNELDNKYEVGAEVEDGISIGFELTGEFTGDMLSPIECEWDVWMWQACRTAFGYAKDKIHRHTFTKPEGNSHEFKLGEVTLYIARVDDEGGAVVETADAPESDEGDVVPRYVPGAPSGSTADVFCVGRYENGLWRVVFSRALSTGNADDREFVAGGVTRMAVAAFDHEEDGQHSASAVILLTLAE
jgi:hypothetical protein